MPAPCKLCGRLVSRLVPRLVAASIALGPAAWSAAELIPILNPGFEELNLTLRPGEQTNGAGGAPAGLPVTPVNTRWQYPFLQGEQQPQSGVLVPGWRTQNPGFGSLAGVLNPAVSFADRPWMTGYAGQYVAAAQAAFMSQTIDTRIQPATRYTLTFRAGIGITDSEYAPLIQLLASPDLTTFATPGVSGVVSLARADLVQIPREQFGLMTQRSIVYTSPEGLPSDLAGKFLAITFLGSDGIPRVVYDDFRLEAVAVPAPVPAALLAAAFLMQARRRSPSPDPPRRRPDRSGVSARSPAAGPAPFTPA